MPNPEINARDLLGPINLGLTPEKLLEELEQVFPELSPQFNESFEKLRWRGGQRDVVRWIRSRLMEDNRTNE